MNPGRVTVRVAEWVQELDGEFETIVTLVNGMQFKCLRPELFVARLPEVVVRDDGGIEYVGPDTAEPVVLVPIWLRGDPRRITPHQA